MAIGNWDTHEREAELAWAQKPEAKKKKKSKTHFPRASFLKKKKFTIFYPILFEFQFLLIGFFSFAGI